MQRNFDTVVGDMHRVKRVRSALGPGSKLYAEVATWDPSIGALMRDCWIGLGHYEAALAGEYDEMHGSLG